MFKALIVGAGRIGAGFNWHDDAYTHAGAYLAFPDRIKLAGFVEPDLTRTGAAIKKWGLPVYEDLVSALGKEQPDVVSFCTQPDQQRVLYDAVSKYECVKAIWQEKPWYGYKARFRGSIQVNYLRRADPIHQRRAADGSHERTLIVYGKDDETTRCHFEDLATWWKCKLDYRAFIGGCSYILRDRTKLRDDFFDTGGIEGGDCMYYMLKNLLDHLDKGIELYSPGILKGKS